MEATLGLAGQQQDSLVQLQQSIAPAFAPPKAVARALERIAAKQVTCWLWLTPAGEGQAQARIRH